MFLLLPEGVYIMKCAIVAVWLVSVIVCYMFVALAALAAYKISNWLFEGVEE